MKMAADRRRFGEKDNDSVVNACPFSQSDVTACSSSVLLVYCVWSEYRPHDWASLLHLLDSSAIMLPSGVGLAVGMDAFNHLSYQLCAKQQPL